MQSQLTHRGLCCCRRPKDGLTRDSLADEPQNVLAAHGPCSGPCSTTSFPSQGAQGCAWQQQRPRTVSPGSCSEQIKSPPPFQQLPGTQPGFPAPGPSTPTSAAEQLQQNTLPAPQPLLPWPRTFPGPIRFPLSHGWERREQGPSSRTITRYRQPLPVPAVPAAGEPAAPPGLQPRTGPRTQRGSAPVTAPRTPVPPGRSCPARPAGPRRAGTATGEGTRPPGAPAPPAAAPARSGPGIAPEPGSTPRIRGARAQGTGPEPGERGPAPSGRTHRPQRRSRRCVSQAPALTSAFTRSASGLRRPFRRRSPPIGRRGCQSFCPAHRCPAPSGLPAPVSWRGVMAAPRGLLGVVVRGWCRCHRACGGLGGGNRDRAGRPRAETERSRGWKNRAFISRCCGERGRGGAEQREPQPRRGGSGRDPRENRSPRTSHGPGGLRARPGCTKRPVGEEYKTVSKSLRVFGVRRPGGFRGQGPLERSAR